MLTFRQIYPWHAWRGAFSELNRVRREMDSMLRGIPDEVWLPESTGIFPLINVGEDANHYYVRAHVPGMMPDDINLTVAGKNLTIQGARKRQEKLEGVSFHRQERNFPTFNRTIGLPGEVQVDKVSAESKDGVLVITLPKIEEAKPKQISIKS
jgi:HSP20 family protein